MVVILLQDPRQLRPIVQTPRRNLLPDVSDNDWPYSLHVVVLPEREQILRDETVIVAVQACCVSSADVALRHLGMVQLIPSFATVLHELGASSLRYLVGPGPQLLACILLLKFLEILLERVVCGDITHSSFVSQTTAYHESVCIPTCSNQLLHRRVEVRSEPIEDHHVILIGLAQL